MASNELKLLLERPAESLNVEVKTWIDPASVEGRAKIVKGVFALRNRNGGNFIVGFNNKTLQRDPYTLSGDLAETYHLDVIQDLVSRYANVSFEITVEHVDTAAGVHPIIVVPSATAARLGVRRPVGYFRICSLTWGGCVAWMLRLVKIGAEGDGPCTDIIQIHRPDDLRDIAGLGLNLAEAKRLLARVQQVIVAAQARDHAVATLFGQVTVRLPRFRSAACGGMEAGITWPAHCRSTPELDRLQAHLCALMTYRTAADLLEQMFPVDAGKHHATLRRHTLKVGAALGKCAAIRPEAAASAIVVTLDSTFIRSCEEGERHLEVRVGNVETQAGGRQVFGAVAKAGTDIRALICCTLDAVGRTECTTLTAFTDGCPGLRRVLADAGVTTRPMLDWFHVAMRLQHLKQIANGLSADDPARAAAKAVIVEEVERLHWRIWNGKAQDAQVSIDRIRAVMHHFQGEPNGRKSTAPSRKLWTALHAMDGYLTGQSAWLVNYAERHRAGLRVGTAITEGTANFLVNRRMNKSQQMRWSRRGADLLLQVRCTVYNGTLGSGFGQKFQPANDPCASMATAA